MFQSQSAPHFQNTCIKLGETLAGIRELSKQMVPNPDVGRGNSVFQVNQIFTNSKHGDWRFWVNKGSQSRVWLWPGIEEDHCREGLKTSVIHMYLKTPVLCPALHMMDG